MASVFGGADPEVYIRRFRRFSPICLFKIFVCIRLYPKRGNSVRVFSVFHGSSLYTAFKICVYLRNLRIINLLFICSLLISNESVNSWKTKS